MTSLYDRSEGQWCLRRRSGQPAFSRGHKTAADAVLASPLATNTLSDTLKCKHQSTGRGARAGNRRATHFGRKPKMGAQRLFAAHTQAKCTQRTTRCALPSHSHQHVPQDMRGGKKVAWWRPKAPHLGPSWSCGFLSRGCCYKHRVRRAIDH